jgi:hypothetical protein
VQTGSGVLPSEFIHPKTDANIGAQAYVISDKAISLWSALPQSKSLIIHLYEPRSFHCIEDLDCGLLGYDTM